jgi:uncharacterized phage protein gp47/JayE
MAFSRPALGDLVTRIQNDFSSRLLNGGTILRRAVVYVLARVYAGAVYLLYGYLDWIYLQAFPDTAESAQLYRWCSIWGIIPVAATFENIPASFVASINGVTIPPGTQLMRSDGTIYTTDVGVVSSAGAAAITVTNQASGASSTQVGTTLQMVQPIAGINSTVTVTGTPGQIAGTPGEAGQTDPSLLQALLNRIQQPPMGGDQNDYVQWAKQVAGVTRAWCYPNNQGNGTVGVAFVMDNNSPIIPGSGSVAAVQAYLTSTARKPVTANVTAFAPVADTLNFTISGISNVTIQAAVLAELQALLTRETQPGGTLLISHINQAIQYANGDGDHILVSPSANVVSATGHIPTMGTITWE